MITHINIKDDTIETMIVQEVIKNPLFKFKIDEMIKLDFRMSEVNPINTKLFIKH